MQNIIVVNVPNAKTADLVVALNTLGFQVDVSAFWRGAIACTGTEFCKLAIAETKGFSKWLVSEMEERLKAGRRRAGKMGEERALNAGFWFSPFRMMSQGQA